MHIQQKLDAIIIQHHSMLCVGLDPVIEKLPERFRAIDEPLFEFNKHIIDATADYVCAFKSNSAFYEGFGASGIQQLKKTFDYIRSEYPQIVTILDAKRGDIGNTNRGYVQYAFEYLQADSITLQPYFGGESLLPFLEYENKGCIVMCKNSNPDSKEFQDLKVDGNELYKIIAQNFTTRWNMRKNVMLVVGATYPQELKAVREIVGDMTLLVPGVGAQGGSLKQVLEYGMNSSGKGLIISSSRDILYASSDNNSFNKHARLKAKKLVDLMN